MLEDFRITGKFKPLEQDKNVITTLSQIRLPEYEDQLGKKNINWKRIYGQNVEQMIHLQGNNAYPCTKLDNQHLIQVSFDIEKPGDHLEKKMLTFGPVIEPQKENEKERFDFVILVHLSQNRISKCLIQFQQNQAQLKNMDVGNNGSFVISYNDLCQCFVQSKQTKTIIFPTLYERIVGLKVFKEILKKGSYSDNNFPLKISSPSETSFNILLSKINSIKLDKTRRNSQLSNKQKKQPKPSIPSTDIVKKSDLKQDSEDSFKHNHKKGKIFNDQRKNMKSSQFIPKQPKQSNLVPSESEYPTSLQDDINYFSEFQNVIFTKDEPEAQTLVLNQSFEQFEKKSVEKDMEKLQYIKKRKEERRNGKNKEVQKLKEKLRELDSERIKLTLKNRDLKQHRDRAIIQNQSNCPSLIPQLKAQIYDLRTQYDQLFDEIKAIRCGEERKIAYAARIDKKYMQKIRSDKDLQTSFI